METEYNGSSLQFNPGGIESDIKHKSEENTSFIIPAPEIREDQWVCSVSTVYRIIYDENSRTYYSYYGKETFRGEEYFCVRDGLLILSGIGTTSYEGEYATYGIDKSSKDNTILRFKSKIDLEYASHIIHAHEYNRSVLCCYLMYVVFKLCSENDTM
jgi:hypothetical protein